MAYGLYHTRRGSTLSQRRLAIDASTARGVRHSIATQVWWGFLILKAVYAMATGDEEARKNEAKNA